MRGGGGGKHVFIFVCSFLSMPDEKMYKNRKFRLEFPELRRGEGVKYTKGVPGFPQF